MVLRSRELFVYKSFLKISKNAKISWRASLRKNKLLNLDHIEGGQRDAVLNVFNTKGHDHILVLSLGSFSGKEEVRALCTSLSEIGSFNVVHFKSHADLPEDILKKINWEFAAEYALLTAFAPFLIISTNCEMSWLTAVKRALIQESLHSTSTGLNGTSLLLLRNRGSLISMQNSMAATQLRFLFRNTRDKNDLHTSTLCMLGAKLTKSFDWIKYFF